MRKNYHDEDYVPPNREKVSAPKKGFSWCACDRVQISDWAKCPVCGHRNGRKRLKP
jgi:hypothetical protein